MSEEKNHPAAMRPIGEIAAKLGLSSGDLEFYGPYKAKVATRLAPGRDGKRGRLVMVTAMTPTPAGEGKTTTVIGLVDAMSRMGLRAAAALREPSLGPVFGMKGGATGGGMARVVPSNDINLHFTGDLHAITSAQNLLAAMADNHVHFDSACGLLDPKNVTVRRAIDMDDRVLRDVIAGVGGPLQGIARETGFDITAACEVMAVFCLARDLADLRMRLGRIMVGYNPGGGPVFASDLKAEGAMTALLRDAFRPNLVQTLEGSPAFIHGGPFANIAHGTNSVAATGLALGLADWVVTETGFASDLGAEKFFDIVVRTGHVPPPAAVVLVATIRSLKYHGGIKFDALGAENVAALEAGFENVRRHIAIVRTFGVPLVVGLNKFPTDTAAEIAAFDRLCGAEKIRFALSDVYGHGGEGGLALAREVLDAADRDPSRFEFLYPPEMPLVAKIETIVRRVYGASAISMENKLRKRLERFQKDGFGALPVCIAKTQYSLSDDDEALNSPKDFTLTVTDVSLRSGAGFVVALCGDIMTMPGLPRVPAAERIGVGADGEITGIIG
jgi:formate--tetrahydrofolate ligase